MVSLFVQQLEAADVAVGLGLDAGHHVGQAVTGKQVRKALLRPQVLFHRHAAADLGDAGDLAAFGFETGKRPVSRASRARRMVSWLAAPQPSGHGTSTCR
jgi:hypothetical protein